MRDYGKVHTSFWTSESVANLGDDAKLMALYLLTCQHTTMAGVVRLPDLYVCEDLSWSKDKVNSALVTLIDTGFIQRCEATKWTWIVRFLEFNPPENPNQKKSLVKIYNQIPDKCEWKSAYLNAHGEVIGLLSNPSATPATPQQPPHETKSTNQQPSQNRSEQSQMTETTLSEPFPNPSATLSKPVTVTGTVIGTVTEEKSLKALVENLEKTTFGELGYDALPDAWGKSVMEDWPELHPDDLRAKWVKFRDHSLNHSFAITEPEWLAEFAKWLATDAPKLIEQRKNPPKAKPEPERKVLGIPISRIMAEAQAGESEHDCAARLNRKDQAPRTPKPQATQVSIEWSRLECSMLAKLQEHDPELTRDQVISMAKTEGVQPVVVLQRLTTAAAKEPV